MRRLPSGSLQPGTPTTSRKSLALGRDDRHYLAWAPRSFKHRSLQAPEIRQAEKQKPSVSQALQRHGSEEKEGSRTGGAEALVLLLRPAVQR